MSGGYTKLPIQNLLTVPTQADLPVVGYAGATAIAADTGVVYGWSEDSSTWVAGGGGGGGDAFTIIQPDLGTAPTATGPTDTLTLTSPDILVTGDSGTKSIEFQFFNQNNLGNSSSYGTVSSLITDLVSYWTLSEPSGTRFDSVGTNNLNKISTTDPGTAAGKLGTGVQYVTSDGTFTAINTNASLNPTGSFTYAGWVNFNTTAGGAALISKYIDHSSNVGFFLLLTSPNLLWGLVDSSGTAMKNLVSTPTVTTNTWYYVVAYYDAGTGTQGLIINNGTPDTLSNPSIDFITQDDFSMGAIDGSNGPPSSNNLDGIMDDWGYWSRTLTPTELTTLYNSGTGTAYPFGAPPSISVDLSQGRTFLLNLNVAATMGFTGGVTGQKYWFYVSLTGLQTLTFTGGNVVFNQSATPSMVSPVTQFWVYYDGTNYIVGA